jgi:hypothetical protein
MKTAIIFADGIKQIIFTPENDDEKQALKLFTPNDDIELAICTGSFGEQHFRPFTASINKCQGGFLRVYQDAQSIMFVLTPKTKKDDRF